MAKTRIKQLSRVRNHSLRNKQSFNGSCVAMRLNAIKQNNSFVCKDNNAVYRQGAKRFSVINLALLRLGFVEIHARKRKHKKLRHFCSLLVDKALPHEA